MSDLTREAWVAFKSGQRWGDFLPDCRDETPDTHWRHDMFAQGFRAALSTTPAPLRQSCASCGHDDVDHAASGDGSCVAPDCWCAALSTTPAPDHDALRLTMAEGISTRLDIREVARAALEGASHE